MTSYLLGWFAGQGKKGKEVNCGLGVLEYRMRCLNMLDCVVLSLRLMKCMSFCIQHTWVVMAQWRAGPSSWRWVGHSVGWRKRSVMQTLTLQGGLTEIPSVGEHLLF